MHARSCISDKGILNVKELHGKWSVDKIDACDAKTGEIKDLRGKLKHILVIPADDRLYMEIEGVKIYEWTSEYDINKSPVWIDLTPRLPESQKKQMSGLLKLKGNNLIIHMGELGSGIRPKDFDQHKGLTSILFICKRAK